MVLIPDGNSEYGAYAKRRIIREKNNPISDCSRSNQMPYTDQIIEIAPYLRTYFWVTSV